MDDVPLSLHFDDKITARIDTTNKVERREKQVKRLRRVPDNTGRPDPVQVQTFYPHDPELVRLEWVHRTKTHKDGFWEDEYGGIRCSLCNRQWKNARERCDFEMSCRCPESKRRWTRRKWVKRICSCSHEPRQWSNDYKRMTADIE
jgi:hypothetical protein